MTSTNSAPGLVLPPTPQLPLPNTTGYVDLPTGNAIWYATFGPSLADTLANQRIPIIFLHGALANSDWWGHQIDFLLRHFADHGEDATTLIAIDLRFLGRSTYGLYTGGGSQGNDEYSFPVTFALKTADTIAVLDHLAVPRAAAVGWSNGATVLVDALIKQPARFERVLLHAGFFDAGSSLYHSPPPPPPSSASPEYEPRTLVEMLRLSQRPELVPAVRAAYGAEYAREPHWGPADFVRIPPRRGGGDGGGGPLVWFVEGQWEEVVVRGTAAVMASWLPGSEAVVLSGVSHYAHLQDPEQFNAELLRFLRA
ncbi:hypothetical protein MCOR27_011039 [Pyricularia oryzae]|uniref:AB hydrolase-1 domain-containing protein n=2 Tax=Pyricularia TaxID=48558 RepID=A0ABQ8NJS2_PYRGI|nr:hypothetical protein MCOR01_005777 [Pyricularia oryzae]KAI6298153.1 hypothetical protein MCOR33_005690 [Pyricularia grisea]KAH9434992.1 hypothetical protein MCOR02_003955 [Pyricularia oryzae]KAI6261756.1 hypothetical protein MCOR19_001970 [Pyricularia oryzae]KAI6266398.1 hypothetical protein MCOR27_011039 [Pyricularia oryzae]